MNFNPAPEVMAAFGTNSPYAGVARNVSYRGFNCRGSGTGIPPEVHENPGLAIAPRMDVPCLPLIRRGPHASRRDVRSQPPRAVSSSQTYRKCGQRRAAMRGIELRAVMRNAEGHPTLPNSPLLSKVVTPRPELAGAFERSRKRVRLAK